MSTQFIKLCLAKNSHKPEFTLLVRFRAHPIMKKSQIKTDKVIRDFLGDMIIETPDDLVKLRTLIQKSLEFRPYNKKTKKHADSIQ